MTLLWDRLHNHFLSGISPYFLRSSIKLSTYNQTYRTIYYVIHRL